jgi:small subunit ribosomal protein S20
MRQNEKRRTINRSNRTRVRSAIKNLRSAISSGDSGKSKDLLAQTVSTIDKAVQKGVLHKNAAARYKSRLTRHTAETAAK